MDFRLKSTKGYTLVELLIYVGLFAVISGAIIMFLATTINTKLTIDTENQFTTEARILMDAIAKEIRGSYSYETQDGGATLILYKDIDQLTWSEIYLANETIYIKRVGGVANRISSPQMVSEMIFEDYTSVRSSDLIHVKLTLENLGTQKYKPAQATLELSTSVNLRNAIQESM